MIGMVPALVGPDTLSRTCGVTLFAFVDERPFAANSVDTRKEARDRWAQWSHDLGLCENEQKIMFYRLKPAGRRALVSVGIAAASVSDRPNFFWATNFGIPRPCLFCE